MGHLVVDQPEWIPPLHGILRSFGEDRDKPRAQVLSRWDPRYGFPLLHEYVLGSDGTTVSDRFL